MIFRFPDLKRWLLVCAVTGMVCPALAQRHGQPIIFSEPDTETVATNSAPSLVPTTPELQNFIGGRSSLILAAPPVQPLPAPVPMISPAQAAAMQEQYDRKKNWALLTPAEILGVPTVENTFKRDDKKGQTVLDRYLERQQRNEMQAATNEAASWSLQGREAADLDSSSSAPQNNSFFGVSQNNHLNADSMNGTIWSPGFNSSSAAATAQTPEQLEAARQAAQTEADDFQKLLQPSLAATPAKTMTSPTLSPTPDSFSAPLPNPVGTTFTPVSSSVVTPQGVTPLPWENNGKNPSTTPVTPEWKRKLPPWMSPAGMNQNF